MVQWLEGHSTPIPAKNYYQIFFFFEIGYFKEELINWITKKLVIKNIYKQLQYIPTEYIHIRQKNNLCKNTNLSSFTLKC